MVKECHGHLSYRIFIPNLQIGIVALKDKSSAPVGLVSITWILSVAAALISLYYYSLSS